MEPSIPRTMPAPHGHPPSRADAELLRFLILARAKRRFLLAVVLGSGLATLLACLLVIPASYLSRAALLPVEGSSERNLLSPSLAEKLPITLDIVERREDRTIMAFLRSRTLGERLLADPELLRELYDTPWDRLLAGLGLTDEPSAALAIQEDRLEGVFRVRRKTGEPVIELTWESRDPDFGARMLGRAIDELRRFLDHEYESDATRQRRFIEGQAARAAEELAAWEGRAPDDSLSLPRIQREIMAAGALHAELTSKLAMARIAEAREVVTFKVLDKPFRPVKKHWPRTGWLTLGAMALGLVAGLLWVVASQAWAASRDERAGA